MNRQIFIIVPSPHPTGPVKGAYALANALADTRRVTMVTLKRGPGVDAPLDHRVSRRTLADIDGGWRAKLKTYRAWLAAAGGRAEVASISMCLSADAVNCFCRSQALTIASVRGNLIRNYGMDYGITGRPLAIAHLAALRRVDHTVAFTAAMARQVAWYAVRPGGHRKLRRRSGLGTLSKSGASQRAVAIRVRRLIERAQAGRRFRGSH